MFDQSATRNFPLQSWAVVLAAVITTAGVVLSACIQSGWIERPSPAAVSLPQASPANLYVPDARQIDRYDEVPSADAQAAANTPAFLTGVVQDLSSTSTAEGQVWTVAKPVETGK